jgi:hypothetical protein
VIFAPQARALTPRRPPGSMSRKVPSGHRGSPWGISSSLFPHGCSACPRMDARTPKESLQTLPGTEDAAPLRVRASRAPPAWRSAAGPGSSGGPERRARGGGARTAGDVRRRGRGWTRGGDGGARSRRAAGSPAQAPPRPARLGSCARGCARRARREVPRQRSAAASAAATRRAAAAQVSRCRVRRLYPRSAPPVSRRAAGPPGVAGSEPAEPRARRGLSPSSLSSPCPRPPSHRGLAVARISARRLPPALPPSGLPVPRRCPQGGRIPLAIRVSSVSLGFCVGPQQISLRLRGAAGRYWVLEVGRAKRQVRPWSAGRVAACGQPESQSS